MVAIRKRSWTGTDGEQRQAWLVDYRDASGKRRSKQFARKRDAETWQTSTAWQVSQGVHTPDSQSITVAKAAALWLERARREQLEPRTIAAYGQHVRLHIVPQCGSWKLSQLTRPIVEGWRDDLVQKLSRPMARRVMRSLGSIVAEAQRRGYVAQNVAAGVAVSNAKRSRAKPTIPSKPEMKAIIAAAINSEQPMNAPLLVTEIFTGLRASELRGLTWSQIDFKAKTMTVDRRADAKNSIGRPKSAAGHRVIPLADVVISELRKWKLRCPVSELGLVFPSERKAVISHTSLHRLHLWPVQKAAELDVRYSSHAFRHCAASLWIEQRVSPKRIQAWMGHSSIQVTFDTYGHLFDQADADSAVMEAVQQEVLGDADATQMQHGA